MICIGSLVECVAAKELFTAVYQEANRVALRLTERTKRALNEPGNITGICWKAANSMRLVSKIVSDDFALFAHEQLLRASVLDHVNGESDSINSHITTINELCAGKTRFDLGAEAKNACLSHAAEAKASFIKFKSSLTWLMRLRHAVRRVAKGYNIHPDFGPPTLALADGEGF